eukprot:scaffold61542_cov63-Phaeocystis_antarctica.AAC.2
MAARFSSARSTGSTGKDSCSSGRKLQRGRRRIARPIVSRCQRDARLAARLFLQQGCALGQEGRTKAWLLKLGECGVRCTAVPSLGELSRHHHHALAFAPCCTARSRSP